MRVRPQGRQREVFSGRGGKLSERAGRRGRRKRPHLIVSVTALPKLSGELGDEGDAALIIPRMRLRPHPSPHPPPPLRKRGSLHRSGITYL
jgi:hypothetical protein